jgi:hypothetical protein
MKVSWYAPTSEGKAGFGNNQLVVPGRYNFLQAAIYRLKLSNIANRPGLELYPTLEVVPSNARTDAFLAHSAVPVVFTDEDFDQVASGNYLVKVVYLPFPQFQDLATVGPDEVVSSRLEPGVDPIAEACRRGNILLVVRVGNIDLEAPNTPPMDAPSPFMLKGSMSHGMPVGMGPGMPGPGPMVPYGFMNQGRPLMAGPNCLPMAPEQLMSPNLPAPPAMGTPTSKLSLPMGPPGGAMPAANSSSAASKANSSSPYSQTSASSNDQIGMTTAQMANETVNGSAPVEKKSWWARHWWSTDNGQSR